MFLNSLKPKIELPSRIDFNERHDEKFKPKTEKEVRLYHKEVIKSKVNDKLKFTNFYSDVTGPEIINRVNDFRENLNVIKECAIEDPVNFNEDRISDIIRLFIP